MAEKNNAVCSICGNSYYLCMSCRDSLKVNPWKVHTDTSEHYKVYQIIHGISTGVYTKDEGKEKFKNVDLSDLNTFKPHIKKIIKDILKEEKPVVKKAEKVEEIENPEEIILVEVVTTDDEKNIENIVEVENAESVDKPTYFRKRNYKTEIE